LFEHPLVGLVVPHLFADAQGQGAQGGVAGPAIDEAGAGVGAQAAVELLDEAFGRRLRRHDVAPVFPVVPPAFVRESGGEAGSPRRV